MARLPNQKRILREDIKEAPNWITRLLTPLNSFMETVYYALNRDITFTENIACQIKEITFNSKSDYSTASPVEDGFLELQFRHSLKTKPKGLLIQQLITDGNVQAVHTTPVTLSWYENNGVVYINYITGLADSTSYTIRLLVI